MSTQTWWVLGVGGALAAGGILLAQVELWLRARRAGTDPVGIFTRGVALRWVGVPLATLHAALFLAVGVYERPFGWWLGGLAAVLLMPLRRLLSLKAFSVIVRTLEYEGGVVVDRDGTPVASQPYWQLVASWHRHEYSGDGVADAFTIKVIAVLTQLLCWPLALLATQITHSRMCQDPCDALGHETDDSAHPGDALRGLGAPRFRERETASTA
jgi:hypothetical protein